MTNGLFKAFFGASRAVDIAVLTIFNVALSLSVYGITMRLTRSYAAAILSAVLVNLYPELALLNRAFWLDFPLTAMVGVGLFSLFHFRANPTWSRALLTGIAVGAACMTKQIAVAYLILPGAAMFCQSLIGSRKSFADALKLVVVGVITGIISAPWFLLNAEKARLMAYDCAVHITHTQSMSDNLLHYAQVLPSTMSPLLMAVFFGRANCGPSGRHSPTLDLAAVGAWWSACCQYAQLDFAKAAIHRTGANYDSGSLRVFSRATF